MSQINCWICGDTATTREHLQKKTDVIAMFGKGSFDGVVKKDFDSGKKSLVQGASSGLLKYPNDLCSKCNNERSQPYDRAYDLFASYIRDNFGKLKRTLLIDTTLVFGKNQAKSRQQELFLYFMKAFGCQLHDRGLPVPQEMRDALLGNSYPKTFRISVALNDEFLEFLQNFPLEGSREQSGAVVDFFWAQHNGWFTVVHAYNRPISPEFGEEWFGKSKQFGVGKWRSSKHNLEPRQRCES